LGLVAGVTSGARELQDLQEGYDQDLCLLCFCGLTRPDGWCHRTMLGEWISQKTGEDVPAR
jgi:Zn-finger protein